MSASPIIQNRRSIVTNTLQSLSEQARLWRIKIDQLEAGQKLDRVEALADLNHLLDVCQNLRDAILSEDATAKWQTKEELHTLVGRLDDAAVKRQKYLDVAQRMSNGTVTHRRERTKQERLRLRDAAVMELMEISGQIAPPDLPGPSAGEWLEWACSLDDSSNDPDLAVLKFNFPRVDDFIRQLELDTWQDGLPPKAALNSEPAPAVTRGPEALPSVSMRSEAAPAPESDPIDIWFRKDSPAPDSGSSYSSHSTFAATEILPELKAETAPQIEFAEPVAVMPEPAPAPVIPIAEPEAVSSVQPTPVPAPATTFNREGAVRFFEPDEIEEFSRALADAKRSPKKARKIRSLVAVSNWLVPRDQNPVLHPKCGIRSLVDYTAATELNAVSAVDAQGEIERAEGLPLLAGGADLLRWSLQESTEKRYDEVASIRRWSAAQIKAWFGEVYKIELAEPQVQDMYQMTFGIPLLVGELHRRIIPMHDAPPSWLGYAIWTRIKMSFDAQIGTLAQELRNGPAAVQLTEREIELLKMMVIASDDSTPDNFAENLGANWSHYRHPEYKEMTDADQISVAVLQNLGLVPMQRGLVLRPLQALLPIAQDDPIRQVVKSL